MSSKVSPSDIKMHSQIGPQTKFITNPDGIKLHCSYWHPKPGIEPRGVVYLCHGFGEHLQWYEELALSLTDIHCIAFGHDHVGHGRSEGLKGHVDDAVNYSRDVLHHCDQLHAVYPTLPCFIVGHSMGGMIAIRTAMTRPEYFSGVVLMGPLIRASPTEATPTKIFFARILAKGLPYLSVAKLKLEHITRDEDIIERLKRDPLRYQGGVRAHWAVTCHDVLNYFQSNMDEVKWPYLILHGEKDKLCDPEGSRQFYKRSSSQDKKIKIFPNAKHHLYLELPDVRKEAIGDTITWIETHLGLKTK